MATISTTYNKRKGVDFELRKFLGAFEINRKWLGRANELGPKNLWATMDTRMNPPGELQEIRSMAYEALYGVRAICKYLRVEVKPDPDKSRHRWIAARKKP